MSDDKGTYPSVEAATLKPVLEMNIMLIALRQRALFTKAKAADADDEVPEASMALPTTLQRTT